jgi:hypothetical protein
VNAHLASTKKRGLQEKMSMNRWLIVVVPKVVLRSGT